jgi:hypothetical protein
MCSKRQIFYVISIQSDRSILLPKDFASVFPKSVLISAHPASQEGRCASSRVSERDAVDAIGSPDERLERGRPSRVVLISRRWDQAFA